MNNDKYDVMALLMLRTYHLSGGWKILMWRHVFVNQGLIDDYIIKHVVESRLKDVWYEDHLVNDMVNVYMWMLNQGFVH